MVYGVDIDGWMDFISPRVAMAFNNVRRILKSLRELQRSGAICFWC
jgi:hypothetical protein